MSKIIETGTYNIYLGSIKDFFKSWLTTQFYSAIFVLVDENTSRDCLPVIQPLLPASACFIHIPSGERNKTIDTCQEIWKDLLAKNADRHALLINLGGGVIGDMGGFAAATYKRGISFIQVPTTLLAQVDASIGGKLGIDFQGVKNSIGLFKDPEAVFIDVDFFKTLSLREIKSGFAEVIKHSLIDHKELWASLQNSESFEGMDWEMIVYNSLMVKKEIVRQDPFEKGIRKTLNFGHTVGHAIESHFLNTENPLLHGEAIAIGMIAEAYLSRQVAGLKQKELDAITAFITRHFKKTELDENIFDSLRGWMLQDKKNHSGKISFSLLTEIGSCQTDQYVEWEEIRKSLAFYNRL